VTGEKRLERLVGKRRAGIVSEHTDEGGATVKCLVSKRLPASDLSGPRDEGDWRR
jgi:hypothetical protein